MKKILTIFIALLLFGSNVHAEEAKALKALIVTEQCKHYHKWEVRSQHLKDHLVDIIEEPIDIIANLTYLPEVIRNDCDKLWTKERMKKIIDAAVKNNVAIEINARYRISKKCITHISRQKNYSSHQNNIALTTLLW